MPELRKLELIQVLQSLLEGVARIDPSRQEAVDGGDLDLMAQLYARRNNVILVALGTAAMLGWECGVACDPAEPDWPVVYIELPTRQVSWHVKGFENPYDGHSTATKYARIEQFCAMNPAQLLVQ